MDFLDRMLDRLESNVELFTFVKRGLLAEGNSIAVRPIPSPPNTTYLNNERIDNYSFQFLVRNKDVLLAENTIESISEYLRNETSIESQDGSFTFVKLDVTTMPNWVGMSEREEHEYTALFQAEIYINGRL